VGFVDLVMIENFADVLDGNVETLVLGVLAAI